MRVRLSAFSLRHAALALGVLVAAACSNSGSSTPTQPDPGPTSLAGASISGTLTSGGSPVGGMRVEVDGVAMSASTDASGRFSLAGVPSGDRVLRFASAQASPAVAIPGVQPSETIEMAVSLAGSSAQIDSISRSSDAPADDPDDGEADEPEDPADPAPTGALTMTIAPGEFSACGGNSHGTLNLFVRGTGYDAIDLMSLLLSGDDVLASPIAPSGTVRIEGNHLKAKYQQSDVYALLLQPLVEGEVRVLTLDYLDTGAVPGQLTVNVPIVACDDTEAAGS